MSSSVGLHRRDSASAAAFTALIVLLIASLIPNAASAAPSAATCQTRNNNTYAKLLDCITIGGGMEHLRAFQRIADANEDTRASGTEGYDQSVAYVVNRLKARGYTPTVQTFPFDYFKSVKPAELQRVSSTGEVLESYTTGAFTYSGSGTVVGKIIPVDINLTGTRASTSGCEAADFAGLDFSGTSDVALMQRGTCNFSVKAANAQAAGAEAAIIFNQGNDPGRMDAFIGTLGSADYTIPVVGASFADGAELSQAGTIVRVFTETISEERDTYNVIAELPGKNPNNVVMLGAHLDSVAEGEGINDNGTGSAGILELAENMGNNKPENSVRFAWWGAEELGLIGSNYYVANLTTAQKERIALYLNFDMIGSPNFGRFIYDGDQSTFKASAPVPPGSPQIEDVFEKFYRARNLTFADTEFSGRSDYQAFILNNIPAGGLFTGAEGTKTPAQVELFGGVAGLAYDPCYHEACDDLEEPNEEPALETAYGASNLVGNVNKPVFAQNMDAIAYAALTFAYNTQLVNGRVGKRVPGNEMHAHDDHGAPVR